MPRPTNVSHLMTPVSRPRPAEKPVESMSDAARAARGRAQIAAGEYLDDDGVDAFLDSLKISTTKA